MACDVPIIAARTEGVYDLLKNNPEWLFSPDSGTDLANAIENRLDDQRTGYRDIKSWADLSIQLEKLLLKIYKLHPANNIARYP